jgi:4'-phosphopantetheinyl transferase
MPPVSVTAKGDAAPAGETLGGGEVHLWFSRPARLCAPEAVRACRELLTAEELGRGGRYHFERDRHRFLVTRALARLTLSRYAPVPPREWAFIANRFGRPFIANAPRSAGLTFNLSHTRDLVVLAVARNQRIGIDVERLDRLDDAMEIARRFFAPAEAASLLELPSPARERRFLEYWTLKEAYIKARGRGLSIPLDRFSFDLSPPGIRFLVDPGLDPRALSWRFAQLQALDGHLAALCVDAPPQLDLRLTVREVVPFGPERPIDLEILRASQPAAGPGGVAIAARPHP